jgi:Na+/H+-dicarboxylate symporter
VALLVFDRVLDMCRTAVNVFADACCAVIVAKFE